MLQNLAPFILYNSLLAQLDLMQSKMLRIQKKTRTRLGQNLSRWKTVGPKITHDFSQLTATLYCSKSTCANCRSCRSCCDRRCWQHCYHDEKTACVHRLQSKPPLSRAGAHNVSAINRHYQRSTRNQHPSLGTCPMLKLLFYFCGAHPCRWPGVPLV